MVRKTARKPFCGNYFPCDLRNLMWKIEGINNKINNKMNTGRRQAYGYHDDSCFVLKIIYAPCNTTVKNPKSCRFFQWIKFIGIIASFLFAWSKKERCNYAAFGSGRKRWLEVWIQSVFLIYGSQQEESLRQKKESHPCLTKGMDFLRCSSISWFLAYRL